MKVGQVVRYLCGDCQVVFDLGVHGVRETEFADEPPVTDFGEPTCCPFCGAGELTPLHDQAVRVAPGP